MTDFANPETPSSPPFSASPSAAGDLAGRRVLLGVSSSIAVYRSLDIVSQLVKRGAEVQVIMTVEATEIVRPLAFETISRRRVVTSLWERPHAYEMEHLEWTKWADLMVVAPATANVIGKIAHGIADDALTTAVLAWPGRLLVAPAMNPTMWENPIVRENLERLRERGFLLVGPAKGLTACGDVGIGRMAPVEEILEEIVECLKAGKQAGLPSPQRPLSPPGLTGLAGLTGPTGLTTPSSPAELGAEPPTPPADSSLRGKRFLITSGPTREYFDPVRFLSNPSSGKMGHALAAEAARRGASVTLVHGPVSIPDPPGVGEIVAVTTGVEMRDAVMSHGSDADVAIFAAAVSDWRPVERLERKQKKEDAGDRIDLALVRNPDIALESLGVFPPDCVRVGFAAETHDHIQNAESKRKVKRFDLLVANNVLGPDGAFGSDDNEAWLLREGLPPRALSRKPKAQLAADLLDEIEWILDLRKEPGR